MNELFESIYKKSLEESVDLSKDDSLKQLKEAADKIQIIISDLEKRLHEEKE